MKSRILTGVMSIAFVLALVAIPLAQDDPVKPPMPPQDRPMRPQQGGGGGSSMVVVKDFIFCLTGNTLYKVNPETMEVVKQIRLEPEKAKPKEGDK